MAAASAGDTFHVGWNTELSPPRFPELPLGAWLPLATAESTSDGSMKREPNRAVSKEIIVKNK